MPQVESDFHQMQASYLLLDILKADAVGAVRTATKLRRDAQALVEESIAPKGRPYGSIY